MEKPLVSYLQTEQDQKNELIKFLTNEISWLSNIIIDAYNAATEDGNNKTSAENYKSQYSGFTSNAPKIQKPNTYAKWIEKFNLTDAERLILILSLAPELQPTALDSLRIPNFKTTMPYTEFGGTWIGDAKRFMPTIETALFLIAGYNMQKRLNAEKYLKPDSVLLYKSFIQLETNVTNDIILKPSAEFIAALKSEEYTPEYSQKFPAKKINTLFDWNDLVLRYETFEEIEEIKIWLTHGYELREHPELAKKIKPGYRTLFYGPPGTGKTLTAALLGKHANMQVYRVDLSMVVSKWVGETEKNLKNIFDQAENKDWILFFDEADSLFSKRSNVSSSNDRYANQEVSYLLQRIEDYNGLVILASNLKTNMDEAFTRRFQSMIHFPMPDYSCRYELWQKAFPNDFELEESIDLRSIARNHEMAGGAIINVINYCCLMAYSNNSKLITQKNLHYAIRKEFRKEGKTVNIR